MGLRNAENTQKIQMAIAVKSFQVGREQGQAAIHLLESAVENFEDTIRNSSMSADNGLDILV